MNASATPQHQPTAAPRSIPHQARWSTERTATEKRALKFRFDLSAAVIKKHVGAAALAVIHVVEPIAKRDGGRFWCSAAHIAAVAKTQDGARLSIKQVRRGLSRAERAGLLAPGTWHMCFRKGKNEGHYVRELLCWPEPRWAGRCYGVTNATKRKVVAMAGHGGKRKGSGKKVGSKERDPEAANAKRRAAYWSKHARIEDTLWSHGLEAEPRSPELRAEYGLAPLTPEQLRALEAAPISKSMVPSTCELVAKRRGRKTVVNQVWIVNQVGTGVNQGGSRISSLREDKEALRSSFGRTEAAAPAAAVVSLVSKPEPTPQEQGTQSVASTGKRERLEDLLPPRDPELGTCVSPPPPFRWNEPRHLMPPFPTVDRFPTAMTPSPPKMPEEMDEDTRVELMGASYRGAVRAAYKKPPPMAVLDKSGRDKKLRAAMKQCAIALQDHDIAPAAWALFSCEVWRENNSTRRPPPQAWVWLESRVDTHHGWFRHGWRGNDIGHRVLMGEAAREAMRRWSELQNELRGARAMTPETVAPIVAKWFPDGTYDHLKERAAFEAKRTQRDLNERALAGEWVY